MILQRHQRMRRRNNKSECPKNSLSVSTNVITRAVIDTQDLCRHDIDNSVMSSTRCRHKSVVLISFALNPLTEHSSFVWQKSRRNIGIIGPQNNVYYAGITAQCLNHSFDQLCHHISKKSWFNHCVQSLFTVPPFSLYFADWPLRTFRAHLFICAYSIGLPGSSNIY